MNYWDLLPQEIQNEIFMWEHKIKFQSTFELIEDDIYNHGHICCDYCSIPCKRFYCLCTCCQSFYFCGNCTEMIFNENNYKKNKKIYGPFRYHPSCLNCSDFIYDNYYFGNYNIKKISYES